MQETIRTYYNLTKPGIIYGNLLAIIAGYLFALDGRANILLFAATIIGTSLVMASACVFNNYIDRNIDSKMKRTAKRALVVKSIPTKNALIYGSVLGILGFGTLIFYTNWLVVAAGAIGMIFYLLFYSIFKRRSPVGTLVGAVPGAMPPVAGYLAVKAELDLGAILLFLIWTFWQLPHFWAIGIYRLKDYKEAGLQVLPVKRGVAITKKYMVVFMILFLISVSFLTLFNYAGIVWLIGMLILGSRWLIMGLQGFKTMDEVKWGKKVFGFSLVVMMGMCLLLSLNIVLP